MQDNVQVRDDWTCTQRGERKVKTFCCNPQCQNPGNFNQIFYRIKGHGIGHEIGNTTKCRMCGEKPVVSSSFSPAPEFRESYLENRSSRNKFLCAERQRDCVSRLSPLPRQNSEGTEKGPASKK